MVERKNNDDVVLKMEEILIEVNRERSKANRMEVIPPSVNEEIDKDMKGRTGPK